MAKTLRKRKGRSR